MLFKEVSPLKKIFLLTALLLTALTSLMIFSTSEAASRRVGESVVYPKEGDCRIVPRVDAGYALDVDGGGRAQIMSTITLEENDGYSSQVFTLKRVKDGWYKIVHKSTGLVLNVRDGIDDNHTRLWLYKDDGTDSCYWRFLDAGDGCVIIQSKLGSQRILDLSNGKARSGATVQLWDFHTKDAGQWELVYESSRRSHGYGGGYQGGYGQHRRGSHDDDDDDDDDSYHGGYGQHRRGEHSRW